MPFLLALFIACSSDTTEPTDGSTPVVQTVPGTIDLSDALLTRRSANCADYVASYVATANDVQAGVTFEATLDITVEDDHCVLASNAIPNHDFNAAPANFATPVAEVDQVFEVTSQPAANPDPTPLTLQYDNAVFLNGVKLDLLAAACYGVGPGALGQERVGCGDPLSPWRYDPMFPGNGFRTDTHNAHTQPDGTYHYHASPNALFDATGLAESPVVAFAADGFPIFGPTIDDNGTLREVVSGYTLKAGSRVSQAGEGAFPGGTYDGTFRDDWTFTDSGDLDACNGMTRDGVYGYYLTNAYPWAMACFRGTPDPSFDKRP